jgi:hypothetical protein
MVVKIQIGVYGRYLDMFFPKPLNIYRLCNPFGHRTVPVPKPSICYRIHVLALLGLLYISYKPKKLIYELGEAPLLLA